jgi:hypothetical protein
MYKQHIRFAAHSCRVSVRKKTLLKPLEMIAEDAAIRTICKNCYNGSREADFKNGERGGTAASIESKLGSNRKGEFAVSNRSIEKDS